MELTDIYQGSARAGSHYIHMDKAALIFRTTGHNVLE